MTGSAQREPIRVRVEVAGLGVGGCFTSFWLCGLSKRPHQSKSNQSVPQPSLLLFLCLSVKHCNQHGLSREGDREVNRSRKERLRSQRREAEGQQTAEHWGPQTRGRDVVGLCLRATDTQDTVAF